MSLTRWCSESFVVIAPAQASPLVNGVFDSCRVCVPCNTLAMQIGLFGRVRPVNRRVVE